MKPKLFVPSRVMRSLRRLVAVPGRLPYWAAARGFRRTANHRALLGLKDCHRGRRCFVIGNGPSLSEMDLAGLRDEITFGSNAFFLAAEQLGFLPTYYNVEDPLPAEDNADILNGLSGTTKIWAHDLRYCLDPSPNTIFVFFDRYYSDHPRPTFPRFSNDALKVVYWGGTVAYMALQLAFFMGIREVYLIGVDLNYKIPDYATGSVIVSQEDDPNHFHPDYFGKGKRWHHPRVDRMERSFLYAARYFAANGGAVYNATAGGKLEALPRVQYTDVMSRS